MGKGGGATAIDLESEADQFTIVLDEELTPTSTSSHVQTDSTSSLRKSGKRKSPMTKGESKKDAELILDGMALIVDAIKDASLKVELGNAFLQTVTLEFYSEKQIFEELGNIGLEEAFRLDAFVYLIRNPHAVRAIFAVPPELRLELLYKFMHT